MPGNPLDALKDIHLPAAASWWPLAWGYWLLLVLILIGVALLARRYYQLRMRRAAMSAFDALVADFEQHQDNMRLAQDITVLIRRTLLSINPREEVARLTGQEWVDVVKQTRPEIELKEATLTTLTASVYQSTAQIDAEALIADCKTWFAGLPPHRASS